MRAEDVAGPALGVAGPGHPSAERALILQPSTTSPPRSSEPSSAATGASPSTWSLAWSLTGGCVADDRPGRAPAPIFVLRPAQAAYNGRHWRGIVMTAPTQTASGTVRLHHGTAEDSANDLHANGVD